ncbi:hypothetical protein C5167_010706 [Papaver somniferum]|uniref:Uncharacterized protein n=1 Tax=Papaver somniferum TaxID=3469 RepID=A0A4Y7K4U6_PAPSO|nr:hypothetical protein C5167_010706 [Papaver somniferum]
MVIHGDISQAFVSTFYPPLSLMQFSVPRVCGGDDRSVCKLRLHHSGALRKETIVSEEGEL